MDILNMYHIRLEELKMYNNHITDFYHLISGTKLLIPVMTEEVEQILEKTEGFVMDYYPKITEDLIPALEESDSQIKPKAEERTNEIKQEDSVERRMPYPGIVPPRNPYKGR